MRHWTVLVVSHDTEKPRSIAVSERALKVAASAATVVLLVAAIGAGAIVAQLGRWGDPSGQRRSTAPFATPARTLPPDVDSLRLQVRALNGALDTIRETDARLRALAGAPAIDTVTLLRRWLPRRGMFRRTRVDAKAGGHGAAPLPSAAVIADSLWVRESVAKSRASADSLLEHASAVVERLGSLADSAAPRQPVPDSLRLPRREP